MLSDKPYCGSCRTPLATKDLFPVISALLLRHKCRYCGSPIPKTHFWTEILVGIIFVCAFLQYNFSEMFLLIAALGTFLVILASIEHNEGYLEKRLLVAVLVAGMLIRTLLDHTLYGFFEGGLFAFALAALIWHKDIQRVGHTYTLPDNVKLMVTGGVCVGTAGLLAFLVLYLAGLLLRRATTPQERAPAKPLARSALFGCAIMLPLLFPAVAHFLSLP